MVDILVETQAEIQELVVASSLKVLEAMLEEDRVEVCGPRYVHQPERRAYRLGHTPSEVVLGGHKVAVRRPRVRRDGEEGSLPSARAFTNTDPLNRRVAEQMLVGAATRQYGRSLEPLSADIRTRVTSKSAVSRPRAAQNTAVVEADDLLFLLNDDAELIVGRIGRAGLERIRGYTVADSATWAQPAISGNRLIIKDVDTVALWTVD